MEGGVTEIEELIENSEAVIEDDIEAELELSDEVEVIVVLREVDSSAVLIDKAPAIELAEQKDNVEEAKTLIVSTFENDGFGVQGADGEITAEYENLGAVAITVTAEGLKKLSQNPNVEAVFVDKTFGVSLQSPLLSHTFIGTTLAPGATPRTVPVTWLPCP